MVGLKEASFHPPAALDDDAGDGEEQQDTPSVLLEFKAYVADRRNETTAVAYSSCGREVQVTLFAARPPRVSHLCVFCRPAATEEHQQMIAMEPQVLATDDDNLVLLRIVVSPEKDIVDGNDLYIYQPAAAGSDDWPSLTRLPRPPSAGGDDDIILDPHRIGILSCPAANDDHDGKFYMVAALCNDESALGRGRYVLHVYNSKLQAWTATNVSVEDRHLQKYQEDGYFLHFNTRAIAVGGEDATVAFVDLWKGILLCDLARVRDKPWLRYVPLPGPSGSPALGDAYRSRDIAVVDSHFKFVRGRRQWKDCPTCGGDVHSWKSAVWTRPVSASSLVDDSWQLVCDMDSSEMDVVDVVPGFHLLPKLGDKNSPFQFQKLEISHPTLSSCQSTICWFMVKVKPFDAKAWVIALDMLSNRLQGVADFDAQRYVATGFAYLHSRISNKYSASI